MVVVAVAAVAPVVAAVAAVAAVVVVVFAIVNSSVILTYKMLIQNRITFVYFVLKKR
jgi:hypothetical protein